MAARSSAFSLFALSMLAVCSARRVSVYSKASLNEPVGNASLPENISNEVRVRDQPIVPGHTAVEHKRVWGVQADEDGICRDSLRKVLAFIELDQAEGRDDAEESQTKTDILSGEKGERVLDEIIDVVSHSDFERQLEVGEVITSTDVNKLVECETGRTSVKLEELSSSGDEEIVEGDILMGSGAEGFEANDSSLLELRSRIGEGHLWAGTLWPNGRIPYCFHSGLAEGTKTSFRNAVSYLEQRTCLKFDYLEAAGDKKCTTTPSIMVKDNKPGCNSHIGKQFHLLNSQRLNLEHGCGVLGVVLHEIGHAIGMAHEHSRPDRDRHIKIVWDNIQPQFKFAFKTHSSAHTGDAYEYASLMHYTSYEFSKGGGPTITDMNGQSPRNMGQRSGFSAQDLAQIKHMYRC